MVIIMEVFMVVKVFLFLTVVFTISEQANERSMEEEEDMNIIT